MTKVIHNRIRWLLGMAAVVLTSGGMSAATETATRLYDSTLLTKTVRTDDGVQYTHLSWLGLDATRTPGAPEMPVEYIRFIVPVYTDNFRVTVTAGGLSRQTLAAPVFPSQEPVLASYEGQVEFTVPNPQYYSSTQPIRAEYVEDGFVDGCNHIVTVAVYPASYDDATLSVTTASTVNVTLEYDSCTAAELGSTPIFPPRASKYLDLKSMVVNGERTANRLYAPREKASPDAPEYYYIITPRNLEEAFQDLAIWKRQKGYNVIVKCIEDVYADPRYRIGAMYSLKNETPQQVVDSVMSLRCYLKDQYQLNGHFFCLLAGDWRTPMPIRKVFDEDEYNTHQKTEYQTMINGSLFKPTDTYFADVTTKWNLTDTVNNSIYTSYLSDLRFDPEITLSRLLCYRKDQIRNYTDKLIIYEGNPGLGDNAYLGKALLFECCNYNWYNSTLYHSACHYNLSNGVKNELHYMDEIRLIQDDAHNKDLKDGYPIGSFPSGTESVKEMSKYGFTSLHTHGSPQTVMLSWAKYFITMGDSIASLWDKMGSHFFAVNYADESGNSILKLTNTNKPAMLFSTGCLNATFDAYTMIDLSKTAADQTVYYSYTNDNIACGYTVDSKCGGIGFIGTSRSGWHTENYRIFKDIIHFLGEKPHLGEAVSYAKSQYRDQMTKAIMHLVGEPEFEMWLSKPKILDITLASDADGVTVQGILPDSTYYTLSNGIRTTGRFQTAESRFTNPYSGEYCFSLWKTGYLPIITLFAHTGSLAESKRYIVRNAFLGSVESDNNSEESFSVVQNGNLYVRALDNITTSSGFSIDDGGIVDFDCEQIVNLTGGVIRKGGKLIIHAKAVKMDSGFKVEPGGILQIKNR